MALSVALVIGGAGCVWTDVEAALALGEFSAVIACNDIGAAWPGPLAAWVSLHPEKFPGWLARRGSPAPLYAKPGVESKVETIPAEINFPGQIHSGSSGLYALKVALIDCGFDGAVCCGIPMERGDGHFNDARPWTEASAHQIGWLEALPEIAGRARSMSGWTATLLGGPDPEWLMEARL